MAGRFVTISKTFNGDKHQILRWIAVPSAE